MYFLDRVRNTEKLFNKAELYNTRLGFRFKERLCRQITRLFSYFAQLLTDRFKFSLTGLFTHKL